MIKKFFIGLIKAYQALSRALFFKSCRFYPTCSQYAIQAIEQYGVSTGFKKALVRIMRCSPLSDGGYDPVR